MWIMYILINMFLVLTTSTNVGQSICFIIYQWGWVYVFFGVIGGSRYLKLKIQRITWVGSGYKYWNFKKITGYERGASVNFQKMPGRRGVQVFEKVRPNEHVYAHIRHDTRLIPGTKEISTPHTKNLISK